MIDCLALVGVNVWEKQYTSVGGAFDCRLHMEVIDFFHHLQVDRFVINDIVVSLRETSASVMPTLGWSKGVTA